MYFKTGKIFSKNKSEIILSQIKITKIIIGNHERHS